MLRISLIVALLCLFFSCKEEHKSPAEKYAAQLSKGLASSQKSNEVFLGIEFGMRPKAFFDHCTELNQQQKILEGNNGRMARFELEDLDRPGWLNFAPKFTTPTTMPGDSAVLFAVNFMIRYEGWAPWNKDFYSLELLKNVIKLMTDRYGGEFVVLPHDKVGRVVCQVQNNRRITLWLEDKEFVRGRFTDLSYSPDDPLVQLENKVIPTLEKALEINRNDE